MTEQHVSYRLPDGRRVETVWFSDGTVTARFLDGSRGKPFVHHRITAAKVLEVIKRSGWKREPANG